MKKKIFIFLTMLLIFPNIGYATKLEENTYYNNLEYELSWTGGEEVVPILVRNKCLASIRSKKSISIITVTMRLEEKSGTSWKFLQSWSGSTSNSSIDMSRNYNMNTGKTYRLIVTSKFTANGTTETISKSVIKSF